MKQPNGAVDVNGNHDIYTNSFNDQATETGCTSEKIKPQTNDDSQKKVHRTIVWRNVVLMMSLHLASLYTLFLIPSAKIGTLIWALFLYIAGDVGVTAGAHRLWSHRSYKARTPLRILLMIFNSIAFQNSIYEWCRDHRLHHKFTETDADPHNAKRGFFFSHIGWLLVRKHPDIKEKGKVISMSDLKADPVVAFQHRYYITFILIWCFIVPTMVPVLWFGETVFNALYIASLLRYCLSLNGTWLVNSAAHMWGWRPYDVNIDPAENYFVSMATMGEGFHNYHHTFPHDYSTSEFGWKLNVTTAFIDSMAAIGQAYDRRIVPKDVIMKRKLRTGDGSAIVKG